MATKTSKAKKKEQTVVLKLEVTYVLKGDRTIDNDIETLGLDICPDADHVEIKEIKVFERG